MADLFWPGDRRAHATFAPDLDAMVHVEDVWLRVLADAGVAPLTAKADLASLLTPEDTERVAVAAEESGNPVAPLVDLLRERLRADHEDAARWLHRGLTSQDVLDTMMVLGARDTTESVLRHLDATVASLSRLAERHRRHVMAGRTLTQHAVPITFGLKAAQWLQGVLDARDDLRAVRFPIQVGGAAGTLSALVELAGDVDAARFLVAETARTLHLDHEPPWHTTRTPFTRYADALVRTTDALGHLANDVLLLARPEIGELAEPVAEGRGGSSTMPHKSNPVLSVLIRRAALTTPLLAAQLHLAAAEAVDERPDGGWHTEWSTLATLSRRTRTASSQAAELVDGLHVDTARMAATVEAGADDLLAERASVRRTAGLPEDRALPAAYLGATGAFIDQVLARAKEQP